jgi:gliding motility-associated-like protein
VGFNKTNVSNPKVRFSNTAANPVTRKYYFKVTRAQVGFPTCSNRDTIKVTIYPKPLAQTLPLLNFRACQGDSITLHAKTNPRLTYQWYTRNTLFTPVPTLSDSTFIVRETGKYFLRVVDTIHVRGGACQDTSTGDSIFIKKRVIPSISGTINFCAGSTDSLRVRPSIKPALSYQWFRDNSLITGANDTVYRANIVADYRVLITDSRFGIVCYDTSLAIHVDSIPRPYNFLVRAGSDTTFPVCSANVPFILAGPQDTAYPTAFNYRWQDGSPNRFFTVDTSGLYYLNVSNQCGSVTDTIRISSIIPTPTFTILQSKVGDTTVCRGIPVRFQAPEGNYYNWYYEVPPFHGTIDSLQTTSFLNLDTREVTQDSLFIILKLQNTAGCSYTDKIFYKIEFCDPVVQIPTAFTPQGDNKNDFWALKAYSVSDATVYIYDRWGQQVYYAKDLPTMLDNPWDGTYNGEKCLQGVYKYIVNYEGKAPNQIDVIKTRKTGSLTLIR